MWPSVIAVLGTLAGGALTFAYQSRLARTAREDAAADRLQSERLEAVAALGTALIAYRHSQLARQTHRLRDQTGSAALSEEVRQRRGDAWAAFFRVELLTADKQILGAAAESMSRIRELKNIRDLDRLDADAELARQSIHGVVRLARDAFMASRRVPADMS